jgi:surface protein
MADWGKGVNNDIGWGEGGTNNIGYGSIYAKSNSGLTLLLQDNTAFIMEVDTSKAGSNSDQFQFTGAEGDYDVVAKQNGIVVQTFSDLSGQETITFANGTGVYVLEVNAKEVDGFDKIRFANGGDKLKITDVKQWGNIVWSSFDSAFFGCSNMLVTSTDVTNLSSVSTMAFMFRAATLANPDVSNWDVSSVNNMSNMFRNTSSANPDTSNWDVSNITNMNSMFAFSITANPDVSNWDVSSVTDMAFMFAIASSANPDVTNWDVSSVTDMQIMFRNTSSANPNARNWNVSSVTNMDRMFENSNLSIENLTACYENWSQLNLKQDVTFGAGTTKYNSSGQAGRDILVNTYNWNITDGNVV